MYPPIAVMNINHRYRTVEEFFASAAASGYTDVDFWTGPMHLYVGCEGFDEVEPVRAAAESYGLRIVGVCPEQNNPKPWNVATANEGMHARTLAYFRNQVEVCVRFGASRLLLAPGWAFEGEDLEAARERSARTVREIVSYAAERGVRVVVEALQPKESALVNSSADLAAYIARVDHGNVAACLDFGAMEAAGETISEAFSKLGEVGHVHFVDCGGGHTHLAWGEGHRCMKDDLDELVHLGYQGICSIETYDSRYFSNPSEADRKSMDEYRKAMEG